MDEDKLPGVLSDLAAFTALTLARGSFSVVTEPDGSSRMRASIDEVISAVGTALGRVTCLEVVWEKKSGEIGPSAIALADICKPAATVGISTLRGGDAPVRAFFTGEGCMALSPLIEFDGRFEGIGV